MEQGFSMIELLIAVSFLTLVLGIGASLYYFGVNSFARAEKLVFNQQQARLAHTIITEKIRYATEIEILQVEPEIFGPHSNYIFIDDEGHLVQVTNKEKSILINTEELGSVKICFETNRETNVIDLTVVAGGDYEIGASTKVLNLASKLTSAKGNVLRYRIL